MAVNRAALASLTKLLDAGDVARLAASAERIDKIEQEKARELEALLDHITESVADSLEHEGLVKMPSAWAIDDVLTKFFIDHWRDTTAAGILEAGEVEVVGDTIVKLAQRKKIKQRTPRNLKELRELYDYFRKNPKEARRFREQAERIRKLYLKKINAYVRDRTIEIDRGARESQRERPYRKASRQEVVAEIKKKAAIVYARSKTTLETETTRNYNNARRGIYDLSPDVTHYLFVAVRDFATTKWCRSRDKLVYRKGDPLLDKETPPIHWNCRSELLPLTPQNPVHLKLIENKSMARRSHKCAPLPPGWVSSRAA